MSDGQLALGLGVDPPRYAESAGPADPVSHLWRVAGCPEPNWQGKSRKPVAPPAARRGACALTGQAGWVWPVAKVSTTLTTLDRFPHRDTDPAGLALGPAAAWAIRHRDAMLWPHAVTGDGFVRVGPDGLYAALVALAADPSALVSVPVSRQKHVVPWAQWGCVGVDDGWLPWRPADVGRLAIYGRLRAMGFGESAQAEEVPRYPVLRKLGPAERGWVLAHWGDLAPWRDAPPYLDVAARATRQPKE